MSTTVARSFLPTEYAPCFVVARGQRGETSPELTEVRSDLIAFTQRTFSRYRPADHHYRIADALAAVERGELDRLIITMPPRHGKSELASIRFPAWYLGRNPWRRIIACSHTASLAYRFSRQARNIVASPFWPFTSSLAIDLTRVQQWDLTTGGGYIAAGVNGPIVGSGAHLLIIDDPVKDAEQADSETHREKTWEWYQGAAYTRLEEGAAIVVIGTRWHEDDLIGRLLNAQETGGDRWTVLHLPALADDGQALWAEKYDVEALARIKANIGSRNWEAQYQGRPSPAEGGTFKRHWWRFYRELPSDLSGHLQSWDMSFKETKSGSYVVGQVWATRGADRYLLDQVRFRGDFPTTVQAVRALSAKWPKATAKLVENKANGPAIVATLRHELTGLIEVEPECGKDARANAVSPQVEAGNVFLPDPGIAPWVGDLVEECAAFPTGAHDDQVDALSQALIRLRQQAPPTAPIAISQTSRWSRPGLPAGSMRRG